VERAARDLGLPVLDPPRVNDAEVLERLQALEPDLLVVASYGQIMKSPLLSLPLRGCVNLHASLLPAWRGAAPVAHALLAGDGVTGVTLMQMDEGLDTGPMLAARSTPITEADDRGLLTARLADMAAELLLDNLERLSSGGLQPQPQDHAMATLAPRLNKADGRLDWSRPALEVARRVRAFSPRPGAFTFIGGRRLLVRQVALDTALKAPEGPPGSLAAPEGQSGIPVRCGEETALRLVRVQPEGRAAMEAAAAMRGRQLSPGDVLQSHAPD
jgi:methionyl-tRNA formyltransferase